MSFTSVTICIFSRSSAPYRHLIIIAFLQFSFLASAFDRTQANRARTCIVLIVSRQFCTLPAALARSPTFLSQCSFFSPKPPSPCFGVAVIRTSIFADSCSSNGNGTVLCPCRCSPARLAVQPNVRPPMLAHSSTWQDFYWARASQHRWMWFVRSDTSSTQAELQQHTAVAKRERIPPKVARKWTSCPQLPSIPGFLSG